MYKKFNVAIIVVIAFGIGYSVNNIAVSDTNTKIAVVDTTQLITNSNEVKKLKTEQQAKLKQIQSTLEKAREELSKETDPQKAAQLEEKYRNEINNQKIAMDENYNKKVKELDNKIHIAVSEKAKQLNYDLILPKDIVFWGGTDITSEIEKVIK
jgi:outer membrane protein